MAVQGDSSARALAATSATAQTPDASDDYCAQVNLNAVSCCSAS